MPFATAPLARSPSSVIPGSSRIALCGGSASAPHPLDFSTPTLMPCSANAPTQQRHPHSRHQLSRVSRVCAHTPAALQHNPTCSRCSRSRRRGAVLWLQIAGGEEARLAVLGHHFVDAVFGVDGEDRCGVALVHRQHPALREQEACGCSDVLASVLGAHSRQRRVSDRSAAHEKTEKDGHEEDRMRGNREHDARKRKTEGDLRL